MVKESPCSPFLNKTRNTKDAIPAGSKQDFLLHANTNHPPAIKTLQNRKIAKLDLLSLTQLAFKR